MRDGRITGPGDPAGGDPGTNDPGAGPKAGPKAGPEVGPGGSGWRVGLPLAGAVLVLDQLTKWWILTGVMTPPRVIEVTGFFNLVLVWNRGISFGVMNTHGPWNAWILSAIALAIAASLTVWLRRVTPGLQRVALGLIIGGALGNVIDRLVHGAVVDFIDLHLSRYHWPAFNVADAAISVGAVLLIGDALLRRDRTG